MNTNTAEIVTTRHNHLIDPHLHIWGWEIPAYLFLGGMVAGILILTALTALRSGRNPGSRPLRLMPMVALGLLSLGMAALFLDLEYKLHVFRFYLAFLPSSPMSWGSWILVLVYPAAFLMGLTLLEPAERTAVRMWKPWRMLGMTGWVDRLFAFADSRRRGILIASLVAGACLGIYTGLLLGVLGARPLWNSTLLGPLFLVSGISTGAAFMLLFRPRDHEHRDLVRWDMAAIGAELLLLGLLLINLATGPQTSQAAAQLFLGGSWTGAFWALVVIAGLLVPLVMEVLEQRKHLNPTAISAALVLVGGISLRFILLMAGQESLGVF